MTVTQQPDGRWRVVVLNTAGTCPAAEDICDTEDEARAYGERYERWIAELAREEERLSALALVTMAVHGR